MLPRTLRVSNLQVSIIPSLSGFARRRPDTPEKREIPRTGCDEAGFGQCIKVQQGARALPAATRDTPSAGAPAASAAPR